MHLREKKLKFLLFISIIFTCSISVIWHYDFGFLGAIPFGLRTLAFSLFFDHSVKIDSFWQSAGIDTAYYKGHYFSGYPPGASFLAAIFFFFEQVFSWAIVHTVGPINGIVAWWLESVALSLPTIISTALTAVLLHSLCRFYKLSKKISFLTGWSYAFTTIIFAYSWHLHYHPIAAFLVFFGFYLLVKNKDDLSKKVLLLMGSLFGLTFLIEYVTVLFALPMTIFLLIALKQKKRFLYFLPGFFFFVLLMAFYNLINFEVPWHFAHNFQEIAYRGETPGINFNFFSFWRGFLGLYLSFPKGLFVHTPLLLMAPIGGYIFYKKDKKSALLLFSSISLVSFVYTSWYSWEGGFNYGPRYISSTQPFYIFLVGFVFQKVFSHSRNRIGMAISVFLLGTSTVIANANALLGTRVEFPLKGTLPLWSNPVAVKRTLMVLGTLVNREAYTYSPFWFRFYREFPLLSGWEYSDLLAAYLFLLIFFEFLPLFVVIFAKEEL